MLFPYGPLGLNSIPWVVAKQTRIFEKNGLDVDMIYVGASAVIVQSMLSGSAGVAGFGGPAVITNVLSGGDIIQVAAMAPYFTQSVVVRSDIRDLRALQGKNRHYPFRFGHRLRDPELDRSSRHQRRQRLANGRFPRGGRRIGARRHRRRGLVAAAQLSHDQRRLSRIGFAQGSARPRQRLFEPRHRRPQIISRRVTGMSSCA